MYRVALGQDRCLGTGARGGQVSLLHTLLCVSATRAAQLSSLCTAPVTAAGREEPQCLLLG